MPMKTDIDRQLVHLKLAPDLSSVKIKFNDIVTLPGAEQDEEEGESSIRKIPYTVDGPFRPHKDLVNSMKKLRKHALDILGIKLEDESKQIGEWSVIEIKIQGDVLTKQSRVTMKLAKLVELTKAVCPIKVPQVTMYPAADDQVKYHAADKMTVIIEDIIEEVWSYLNGKYDETIEPNQQFALFPSEKPILRKAS